MKPQFIGQRFGRLLVTGTEAIITKSNRKQPMAICSCDCGVVHRVSIQVLRSGGSQSCGCLRRQLAEERGKRARREELKKQRAIAESRYFPAEIQYPSWLT